MIASLSVGIIAVGFLLLAWDATFTFVDLAWSILAPTAIITVLTLASFMHSRRAKERGKEESESLNKVIEFFIQFNPWP